MMITWRSKYNKVSVQIAQHKNTIQFIHTMHTKQSVLQVVIRRRKYCAKAIITQHTMHTEITMYIVHTLHTMHSIGRLYAHYAKCVAIGHKKA